MEYTYTTNEIESLITETLLEFFNDCDLLNNWDPRNIELKLESFCKEILDNFETDSDYNQTLEESESNIDLYCYEILEDSDTEFN